MFGNKNKKEAYMAQESIERIKLFRTILILFIILIAIIAALIVALKIISLNKEKEEEQAPQLTSTAISQQLANCSNLTTAELTYNGLIHFSEGDIPLINQNSFSMIYEATAKAGIDISEADITVTDTDIIILLPECEVTEINVNPDSLEFYDEHTSIFNRSEKTDVVTALQYAEDDVKEKADLKGLTDRAQAQTELIIKGLIEPIADEHNIIIDYKTNKDNEGI